VSDVNIFTDYSQEENRFTNGLFSILSLARVEFPEFVSDFFSDLLEVRSAYPFDSFHVLKGVVGTVDADVRSEDTCILFETKIESIALESLVIPDNQVDRHVRKLRTQEHVLHRRLVLLTPDDGKSNYISKYLQYATGEIQHLAWKDVYVYLKQFAELHPKTTLAGLIHHFLHTIHTTIFQQDIAGIIQTIKLGKKSGVYAGSYLEEMKRGDWTKWRTPKDYKLSGTRKKLLLYDPKRKSITVEVEIAEVIERPNEDPDYPWVNIFAVDTLNVLESQISRDFIRTLTGLEKLGIGQSAFRKITHEQYAQLRTGIQTQKN